MLSLRYLGRQALSMEEGCLAKTSDTSHNPGNDLKDSGEVRHNVMVWSSSRLDQEKGENREYNFIVISAIHNFMEGRGPMNNTASSMVGTKATSLITKRLSVATNYPCIRSIFLVPDWWLAASFRHKLQFDAQGVRSTNRTRHLPDRLDR